MEHLKKLIEDLYPINAYLLGEGYDKRLEYLKGLFDLDILEFKSGTKFSTWTVPDEWIIKEGWVKNKGKKIIDYKKSPFAITIGSKPFHETVDYNEFSKHAHWSDERPELIPYVMKYYDNDWGVCLSKNQKDKLKEGEYEVFIDTERKKGTMKIGVHTIKGKSDREILIFAHLDHPFQANDNLSGVACLLDLKEKLKSDHTIKLIFCPETIGSIAYAHSQDISRVDFAIAVDICGNDKPILMLKAFDQEAKINRIGHCAFQIVCEPYRKAQFRATIGSDETVFNDPLIGIPSVCLTTHPYDQYHTEADTPEHINYGSIEKMSNLIVKMVEIADKDYIPVRNFKGPLFRTAYNIQSSVKQINLNYDYLFYLIDGKRSLVELCAELEFNFDKMYELFTKMEYNGHITRLGSDTSEK